MNTTTAPTLEQAGAELERNVVYVLAEGHPLYQAPVARMTKPLSDLRSERVAQIRSNTGRDFFRFADVYEPNGDLGPRHGAFPAGASFQENHLFIDDDGRRHVGRGMFRCEGITVIDRVEHAKFVEVQTMYAEADAQRAASEKAFVDEHGESLRSQLPAWASPVDLAECIVEIVGDIATLYVEASGEGWSVVQDGAFNIAASKLDLSAPKITVDEATFDDAELLAKRIEALSEGLRIYRLAVG